MSIRERVNLCPLEEEREAKHAIHLMSDQNLKKWRIFNKFINYSIEVNYYYLEIDFIVHVSKNVFFEYSNHPSKIVPNVIWKVI